MKAEDLISPGDRAKRSLRIAQALAQLSKMRAPELLRVQDVLTRLAGTQPAVAMALIMEYANRQPLHKRGPWLKAAAELLGQYRLTTDADQLEADQARDYLNAQEALCQAECDRRERNRERREMVVLGILVALMLTLLWYAAFLLTQKSKEPTTSSNQTSNENHTITSAGEPKPETPPTKAAQKDNSPAK
jgi:hypothetical protein